MSIEYATWVSKSKEEQTNLLRKAFSAIQKAKESLQEKLTKPKEEPRYAGIKDMEAVQKREYGAMLKVMVKDLKNQINDYTEPTTNS